MSQGNPVDHTIDRMLSLTADIAEALLQLKDADKTALPDELKIKIITLAELAATPGGSVDEPEADEPAKPAEPSEAHEPAEPEVEVLPEDAPDDGPLLEEEEMEAEAIETEKVQQAADATQPAPIQEQPAETAEVNAAEETDIEMEMLFEEEPEPTPEPATATEPEPQTETTSVETASEEAPLEPAPAPEVPAAPAPEPALEAPAEPVVAYETLRRAFSINDAFLFRREIFGGSNEQFQSALRYIATLQNRRQLHATVTDILRLDADSFPGKDFYDLLSPYFPE